LRQRRDRHRPTPSPARAFAAREKAATSAAPDLEARRAHPRAPINNRLAAAPAKAARSPRQAKPAAKHDSAPNEARRGEAREAKHAERASRAQRRRPSSSATQTARTPTRPRARGARGVSRRLGDRPHGARGGKKKTPPRTIDRQRASLSPAYAPRLRRVQEMSPSIPGPRWFRGCDWRRAARKRTEAVRYLLAFSSSAQRG